MSTNDGHEPAPAPRVVEDAVCTACSCFCDDIELHLTADRITDARHACTLGALSLVGRDREPRPACMVDGHPASWDEAIDRAARILAAARYPLILGLAATTCEAQRAAVSLADRVGACLDVVAGAEATGALQRVGEVTCTLGEIKNRADLVVVWGADPLESHPRLFSRYAPDPSGTFVPGGRGDRYCVVVDAIETQTVREAADQFIAIKPRGHFAGLWVLRALARGIEPDAAEVETTTRVALATWQQLLDRIKAARYGALFYGTGGASADGGHLTAYAAHALTRDLNGLTRFVCMPLHSGRNATGAHNVLTWQTGYPSAISMAAGYPRYGPGEFTASDVLRRGENDAALVVWDESIPGLNNDARAHLSRVPCIVLRSASARLPFAPAVAFETDAFGINTAGTVFRMDGVALPLRPATPSPLPGAEEVLRAIERHLGSEAAIVADTSGVAER